MKCCLGEIGEIVRCLPDKKFRLALQLSLLRESRPKSARASPQKCAQSAQGHIQIGSLSVESVMKHSLLLCLFLYGICPLYSVAVKQIIAQALYIADSGVSQ